MSDKEEQSNREVEVEGTKPPTPMAETDQSQQQQQKQQSSGVNLEKMSRFSIWPPTQHTREAVIKRLVETLSTPSVLSKRYGSMPPEEASSAARQIEEEAYSAPSLAASSNTAEDDGIEILQLYSKEISKKMLETVKARAASVSSPDNPSKASDAAADVTAASATRPASEEISSAQTES